MSTEPFDQQLRSKLSDEHLTLEWNEDRVWAAICRRERKRRVWIGWRNAILITIGIGLLLLMSRFSGHSNAAEPDPPKREAFEKQVPVAETEVPKSAIKPEVEAIEVVNEKSVEMEPDSSSLKLFSEPLIAVSAEKKKQWKIANLPEKSTWPRELRPLRPTYTLDQRLVKRNKGISVVIQAPLLPDFQPEDKPFVVRLLKQLKNFNTHGKIDWRELHIQPDDMLSIIILTYGRDSSEVQIQE